MKVVNFFDGYTSTTVPIQIGISELVVFGDDASFELEYDGSPKNGDIYFNDTLNRVRYYNGTEWVAVMNNQDFDLLQSQIDSNDLDISNLQTLVTQNAADIGTNQTDIATINASIGSVNGIAPLGPDSKVPAINLPSYVDDVEEYADLASFPVTGETGKIYVDLVTNKTYRWSGTTYVEISPSEVNSVNGYTGIITLDNSDIGLTNVTDDAQLKRDAGDFDTFLVKDKPVREDIVLIEDSEDAFNKKKVQLKNLLGGGDGGFKNYLGTNSQSDNGTGDWIESDVSATLSTITGTIFSGESSFSAIVNNPGITFFDTVQIDFSIDPIDTYKRLYISGEYQNINETSLVRFILEDLDNSETIFVAGDDLVYDSVAKEYLSYFNASDSLNYRLIIQVADDNSGPVNTSLGIIFNNLRIGPREVTTTPGRTHFIAKIDTSLNITQNDNNAIVTATNPSAGIYRLYYNESLFPSTPNDSAVILLPDLSGPTRPVSRGQGVDGTGAYVEYWTLTSAGSAINMTGTDELQVTFFQKEQDIEEYRVSTAFTGQNIVMEGGIPSAGTSANNPIVFSSVSDNTSMYNDVTGEWTIPEDGIYEFTGFISPSTTGSVTIYLHINGVQDIPAYSGTGVNLRHINVKKVLKKGDVVELISNATLSYLATPENTQITVTKQETPQTLLAQKFIGFRYTISGSPSVSTSGLLLTYTDKDYDTNNMYDTSTGQATIVEDGFYTLNVSTVVNAPGNFVFNQVFINGVNKVTFRNRDNIGFSGVSGSDTILLNKGDVVEIRVDVASNSSLQSNPQENYFSLIKVG